MIMIKKRKRKRKRKKKMKKKKRLIRYACIEGEMRGIRKKKM